MKLIAKITAGLVVSLLAVFIGIAGLLYAIGESMCGNEILNEVASPDSTHKAVIFQRDCGATTGFSTQISILAANDQLNNESGNIYTIDGHPEDMAPALTWQSSNKLVISHPLTGSANSAKTNWSHKITVEYDANGS